MEFTINIVKAQEIDGELVSEREKNYL